MKFKTKKYIMLKPLNKNIQNLTTKILNFSTLQLKKKFVRLFKKQKKLKVK